MICPHCDKLIFQMSKDKSRAKAKVTCLILHKSGDVEINCPLCKRGILLPFHCKENGELQKSQYPKHTMKKSISASKKQEESPSTDS